MTLQTLWQKVVGLANRVKTLEAVPGGAASWGTISGDIGDQADLAAAFSTKADTTALDAKADKVLVTRTASGTTDTVLAADVGKEVRCTNAAAKEVTIPGTAVLGEDFICAYCNLGAGDLTFASSATIRNDGTVEQYKTVTLRAIGADEYLLTGELI